MHGKRLTSLALATLLAAPLALGNLDPAQAQVDHQSFSDKKLHTFNCVEKKDYEPIVMPELIWDKTTAGICHQKKSGDKRAVAKFKPRGKKEKVAVTSWGNMKHTGLVHKNQLGIPSCFGSTRYTSGKTKIYCTFR